MTGWDGLAYFDENYRIRLSLAEELSAEKANQYLIRFGTESSSTMARHSRIDDVIYSIKRTKTAKLKLFGNAGFGAIDLKKIKKLDSRTARLTLSRPDVTLMEAFAQYFQGIVPVGYQPNAVGKGPLRFIGTGPFKVKSFTPGRAERPRPQRELLAHGAAVLRRGADHQLPRRLGQGERAALRPGRRDQPGAVRAGPRAAGGNVKVLDRADGARGTRSPCASTRRRSTTCACARRSAS